jgi:hypothetical protein
MSAPLSTTGAAVAGTSFLEDFEYRFRLLGEGPQPLSLNGRSLGHGLPRRPIALTELASILMHPSCDQDAKDAAWRRLARNARTDSSWAVGAIGVAIPGLRKAAYRLWLLSAGDVEATLVGHFYEALLKTDLVGPDVFSRMLNTAFVKARRDLDKRSSDTSGEARFVPASRPPAPSFDHPDFVLVRAVQAGVITAAEADLIGATYLEKLSVGEYAEQVGRTYWQVYRERGPAVARLVAAIESGALSDPVAEVVAEATTTIADPDPAT